MTQFVFSDNANGTLAAPIVPTSSSLSVLAGEGALFPSLSAGQGFIFTLNKNGAPNVYEVCLCTGISGDTFTSITRNYSDNQGPQTWNAGDFVSLFPTAASLNQFLQVATAQPEAYTFALDTGSTNTYVVNLTPSPTLVNGQKFRFVAAHTNTGNCTFNGLQLLLPSSAQVPAGTITTSGYYEAVYSAANFYYLFGSSAVNLTNANLPGTPTAATAPVGTDTTQLATTQFVQGQLFNNVRTGTFNSTNGTVTVTFASAFPNECDAVMVTPMFMTDVGYVVNGSVTTSGFQYTNGNAGALRYLAVGK